MQALLKSFSLGIYVGGIPIPSLSLCYPWIISERDWADTLLSEFTAIVSLKKNKFSSPQNLTCILTWGSKDFFSHLQLFFLQSLFLGFVFQIKEPFSLSVQWTVAVCPVNFTHCIPCGIDVAAVPLAVVWSTLWLSDHFRNELEWSVTSEACFMQTHKVSCWSRTVRTSPTLTGHNWKEGKTVS